MVPEESVVRFEFNQRKETAVGVFRRRTICRELQTGFHARLSWILQFAKSARSAGMTCGDRRDASRMWPSEERLPPGFRSGRAWPGLAGPAMASGIAADFRRGPPIHAVKIARTQAVDSRSDDFWNTRPGLGRRIDFSPNDKQKSGKRRLVFPFQEVDC